MRTRGHVVYTCLHTLYIFFETHNDVSWPNSWEAVKPWKSESSRPQNGLLHHISLYSTHDWCYIFLPLQVCVSAGGIILLSTLYSQAVQTEQLYCGHGHPLIFATGPLQKNALACAEYWLCYLIKYSNSRSPLIIHSMRLSNSLSQLYTNLRDAGEDKYLNLKYEIKDLLWYIGHRDMQGWAEASCICVSNHSNDAKFINEYFIPHAAYTADILSLSQQSLNCPFLSACKTWLAILTVSWVDRPRRKRYPANTKRSLEKSEISDDVKENLRGGWRPVMEN